MASKYGYLSVSLAFGLGQGVVAKPPASQALKETTTVGKGLLKNVANDLKMSLGTAKSLLLSTTANLKLGFVDPETSVQAMTREMGKAYGRLFVYRFLLNQSVHQLGSNALTSLGEFAPNGMVIGDDGYLQKFSKSLDIKMNSYRIVFDGNLKKLRATAAGKLAVPNQSFNFQFITFPLNYGAMAAPANATAYTLDFPYAPDFQVNLLTSSTRLDPVSNTRKGQICVAGMLDYRPTEGPNAATKVFLRLKAGAFEDSAQAVIDFESDYAQQPIRGDFYACVATELEGNHDVFVERYEDDDNNNVLDPVPKQTINLKFGTADLSRRK